MSTPIADDQEILSGEAVAIDVQPIGFLLRAAGGLVDMLISFVVYFAFVLLQLWLTFNGLLDQNTGRIYLVATLVTSFLVLPVTIEMATRGRSLGKLIVGGRIVRVDGGAITFRHSFIRGLIGVLEVYATLGGLAVVVGALTARSQRLGDLVAGTYSQRVRTPPLPPHEPVMPYSLAEWATIADVARLPDRLARRISQFLRTAHHLAPAPRTRIAHELLVEATPYISPMPAAPAEEILQAATVLRRERERRALALADARTEKLTGRRVGV